jgi:signal transduction histidine kinase/ActR/RegA family two-component response regulator
MTNNDNATQLDILANVEKRASATQQDASASLANIVIQMIAVVTVIGVVALIFSARSGDQVQDWTRIAIAVAAIVGMLAVVHLARRGRLRLGIAIAFGLIYLAITIHAVVAGFGIHAYMLGMLGLVISGCYLLINTQIGHASLAISGLTVIALYVAEVNGMLVHDKAAWQIPARNVLVVYLLTYAISALTGMRYSKYFAALIEEINRQSDQLRHIISSLPCGCMLCRDDVIIMANDLFKSHLGIDIATTLKDHKFTALLPPSEQARAITYLTTTQGIAATQQHGTSAPLPFEFVIAEGEVSRTVHLDARTIMHDGRPALLIATQDVTERATILAALDEERRGAVAAAQAKSTFLATMSHEIRTPLNAVIGLTDLMRVGDLDEATRKQYLGLVLESSETLLAMLNDILDMAKLDAGKLEIRQEPVDVRALCTSIEKIYAPLARERRLRFDYVCDSNLTMCVMADNLRLRQVLSNLMSNALKFTRDGGIRLQLRLYQGNIEIDVIDTGIGIREADQPRLFTPFEQADGDTTREFGGTGLGLAICRELMIRMQGSITVTSEPGMGSRFRLALPAMPAVPLPDNSATTLANSNIITPTIADTINNQDVIVDADKHYILVIDDNEINAMVATAMLSSAGYRSMVCTDGESAVALCQTRKPLLVLLDINLPGMDGFACAKALHALEDLHDLPIVANTAWNIARYDTRLINAGIVDVLHKPTTRDSLRQILQKYLPDTP